ncbi:uncharacterized protein CCOS01_11567, partial [Colletotrichum costaricense]
DYFQLCLRPWTRESKHRQHPRYSPRLSVPSTPFLSDPRLLFVELQPNDGPPRCSLPARPRRARIPMVMPPSNMSRMGETRDVSNKRRRDFKMSQDKPWVESRPRNRGPLIPRTDSPPCPCTFRLSPAADPHL